MAKAKKTEGKAVKAVYPPYEEMNSDMREVQDELAKAGK